MVEIGPQISEYGIIPAGYRLKNSAMNIDSDDLLSMLDTSIDVSTVTSPPKDDKAGSHIGLEFKNVSQNDRLLLHYFINTVTQEE